MPSHTTGQTDAAAPHWSDGLALVLIMIAFAVMLPSHSAADNVPNVNPHGKIFVSPDGLTLLRLDKNPSRQKSTLTIESRGLTSQIIVPTRVQQDGDFFIADDGRSFTWLLKSSFLGSASGEADILSSEACALYRDGEKVRAYTLGDFIPRKEMLLESISHVQWRRNALRLEEQGLLRVETNAFERVDILERDGTIVRRVPDGNFVRSEYVIRGFADEKENGEAKIRVSAWLKGSGPSIITVTNPQSWIAGSATSLARRENRWEITGNFDNSGNFVALQQDDSFAPPTAPAVTPAVTLQLQTSNSGPMVVLNLTEYDPRSIEYRFEGHREFRPTGLLAAINPRTGRPQPANFFYIPRDIDTSRPTLLFVRWEDRNGKVEGPFELKFDLRDLATSEVKALLATSLANDWALLELHEDRPAAEKVALWFTTLLAYKHAISHIEYRTNESNEWRAVRFRRHDQLGSPSRIEQDDEMYTFLPPETRRVFLRVTFIDGSRSEEKEIFFNKRSR